MHRVEIKKESKRNMGDVVKNIEVLKRNYPKGFETLGNTLEDIYRSEDPLKHPKFDDSMRYLFFPFMYYPNSVLCK